MKLNCYQSNVYYNNIHCSETSSNTQLVLEVKDNLIKKMDTLEFRNIYLVNNTDKDKYIEIERQKIHQSTSTFLLEVSKMEKDKTIL